MLDGERPTRGPESDRGHGCQRESSRGVENLSPALATRLQMVAESVGDQMDGIDDAIIKRRRMLEESSVPWR